MLRVKATSESFPNYTPEGYDRFYMSMIQHISKSVTYRVPAMHREQCTTSVKRELGTVEDVEEVEIDLENKLVTVRGRKIHDAALRAAINEAGYEATCWAP